MTCITNKVNVLLFIAMQCILAEGNYGIPVLLKREYTTQALPIDTKLTITGFRVMDNIIRTDDNASITEVDDEVCIFFLIYLTI